MDALTLFDDFDDLAISLARLACREFVACSLTGTHASVDAHGAMEVREQTLTSSCPPLYFLRLLPNLRPAPNVFLAHQVRFCIILLDLQTAPSRPES